MSFFTTSYIDVSYNESVEAVVSVWKGYAQAEQIKEASEKALELASLKKSSRFLFDCKNAPTFTKEVEEWNESTWSPKAIAIGIKWIAIVQPGHIVKDNVIKRMTTTDVPIQIALLSSYEEAIDWLK